MISDIFNNREIASAFWLLAVLFFFLLKDKGWSSVVNLIKATFAPQLVKFYFSVVLYISFIIYFLSLQGLWDFSLLKVTIYWTVLSAIVTCSKTDLIKTDPHLFRNVVLANVSVAIALEFIIAFYSYDLWVELIMLPMISFVAMTQVFATQKSENKKVESLMNGLSTIYVVLILFYTTQNMYLDYQNVMTANTLFDFLFPILMMILFIPYLYWFRAFVIYEHTFTMINVLVPEELRKFAKIQAIKHFNFDVLLVERWRTNIALHDRFSKEGLVESIKHIKKQKSIEKNPPSVESTDGWSPYDAINFLSDIGIKTGNYNKQYDDEWFASSPYKELGKGIIPNNIAYYISGNSHSATNLKLMLNINSKDEETDAKELLLNMATILYSNAMDGELHKSLQRAILSGKDKKIKRDEKIISVKKEVWPNKATGGYDITFQIQHIEKPKRT